jgi:chromosome segregation ATPase
MNRNEDSSKTVLTEQHLRLRASEGRISALESSLEEEIARRTSAERDRTNLQRQLHDSEETCRQLRNDLSTTRSQLRNLKESEVKMKTQLDQMRALFVRVYVGV